MVNLDDLEVYEHYDPSGMRRYLREMAQECDKAWQKALSLPLPEEHFHTDQAIILGMGGSAIGGDLVRSLTLMESGRPIWVHRDYNLPLHVDERTLIIASSYSGNTEETLMAFQAALETPAKKLVLTTGGRLKAIAEENGIPVFSIDYAAPPRAAFGHSFIPLVGIFHRLGWLRNKAAEMAGMIPVLEELASALEENQPRTINPAKQLAGKLWGRLVVIYAAGFLADVARRWKTQFNENSKSWAFYELLPELHHNAVVGYDYPVDAAEKVFIVFLRADSLHPRLLLRYRLTQEILSRKGIDYQVVEAKGETPLTQMMSLVLFGDYVSYYLAMLNRVDPSPVSVIDYLKEQLARS
jgi:glucose/mannose-6-phosphate isomerase